MRYLATFLRTPGSLVAHASETELTLFGERYALTNTEVSILAALLRGYSLRNIAEESGRSYGTMRWHVQNILGKCQVKTQQNLLNEFYRLIKS
jgi:DNA-binding NarL/FixJ family response regulator